MTKGEKQKKSFTFGQAKQVHKGDYLQNKCLGDTRVREGEYASYWVNFRHGVDSWPSSATAGWCHSSPPPGNRTQYAQALECEGGQGHQEEACPFTAVCWDRKKCHYSGIWEAVLILPGCHTTVPEGRLSLGKQVVKTSWEDSR